MEAEYGNEIYFKEIMTRHTIEIVRVAATECVGGYTLHSMRIDEIPQVCDMSAYRLSANIAAEALRPQTDCDFGVHHKVILPDGWWQQLKKTWFPSWFLRFFPVKNRTLEVETNMKVEVLATYPMLNTVFPPGENHPVIKVFGRGDEHGTCVIKITKGATS